MARYFTDKQAADRIETLMGAERARTFRKHFPGLYVGDLSNVSDALATGQADFTVEKRPLMAVIDGETAVEVPGKMATVRTDTWAPLGVVGSTYGVIQTAEAVAPLQAMIDAGDARLGTVSVKNGGERVRLVASIGASAIETLENGADVLMHAALFEAAHDGQACTTAYLYTLRLSCLNGNTSRTRLNGIAIRHTTHAANRLEEAARVLLGLRKAAEVEALDFQEMAQRPMSSADFRTFAGELLDEVRGKLETDSEKIRARREAEIEELLGFFRNGQGNHGVSAWDGYNSVTEWLDHKLARAGVSEVAKQVSAFESNAFGHGQGIKAAARRRLLA